MSKVSFNSNPPVIIGKRVILRPMGVEYATETYINWLKDPIATEYIASIQQTTDDLISYIKERIDSPTVRFWAICDKTTNLHIGNVKLEPINWDLSKATFGILIGDRNFWRKGIATEVTVLTSDFAFNDLKIQKVDLGVDTLNLAAIKAYKKAGFHVEGSFRRHVLLRGKVRDSIYMAKFADGSEP